MPRPSIDEDKAQFLERVKAHGGSVGNTRLRGELGWTDERYWRTHAILLDEGGISRGRGKGGSVNIVGTEPAEALGAEVAPAEVILDPGPRREVDLYEPAKLAIESGWVRERGFDEAIVEITGLPGRRTTGGTWTRPDLAVLAVKAYPYMPGRHFDMITFEVKKSDAVDVMGVFEALSHLQFASLSYVVFCTNGADFENTYKDTDRILSLAKTHGVGVIVATDIGRYETWEEYVEPRRNVPDPEQANLFIGTCFSEEAKARVIKWHK